MINQLVLALLHDYDIRYTIYEMNTIIWLNAVGLIIKEDDDGDDDGAHVANVWNATRQLVVAALLCHLNPLRRRCAAALPCFALCRRVSLRYGAMQL